MALKKTFAQLRPFCTGLKPLTRNQNCHIVVNVRNALESCNCLHDAFNIDRNNLDQL